MEIRQKKVGKEAGMRMEIGSLGLEKQRYWPLPGSDLLECWKPRLWIWKLSTWWEVRKPRMNIGKFSRRFDSDTPLIWVENRHLGAREA